MIRRPPRSTLDRSSAASDVYKRQDPDQDLEELRSADAAALADALEDPDVAEDVALTLSLIHISEPTRPY